VQYCTNVMLLTVQYCTNMMLLTVQYCTNVMLLTLQIGLLEPTVITTTTTTTKIRDPQSTRGPRRIYQIKSCSEVWSSNRSSR